MKQCCDATTACNSNLQEANGYDGPEGANSRACPKRLSAFSSARELKPLPFGWGSRELGWRLIADSYAAVWTALIGVHSACRGCRASVPAVFRHYKPAEGPRA
jgi:hypothetical protein